MKAKNVEEFFGTLQQATVEAWKSHLKTDKYSKHIALNEFYEDIVDLVDTLIEDYMGLYGKVEKYVNIMSTDKIGAIDYLEELHDLVKSGRKDLFKEEDTELSSDIDAILSLIDSTLYKLKELKESRLSLKNYLNESLDINEAREEVYSVAFSGFVDKEGSPLTVQVHVPKEYAKDFEKYLEKEVDNTIYNAEGRTNNWELDRW